jgi:hypothetical protein
MPIEIACPKCHRRMRAPDASAGRKVKCLVCQEPIQVPGGEAEQPQAAAKAATPVASPAAKPKLAATPAPSNPVVKKTAAANPSLPVAKPLTSPAKTAANPALRPTPKAQPKPVQVTEEKWTLMTEDDQEFGPVPRSELDSWFAEGLITAKCQVLKEGGTEWQFAPELYPSLAKRNPRNQFRRLAILSRSIA